MLEAQVGFTTGLFRCTKGQGDCVFLSRSKISNIRSGDTTMDVSLSQKIMKNHKKS